MFKTSNNLPCPACMTEIPKPSNKHISANCDDCYSNTDTWSNEEVKSWQCMCYSVNHDKSKLKGYKPLPDEILKLIEVERSVEKNQKAKDYYTNKVKEERQTQLDYAEAHPRQKEVFDE